MQKASLVLLLLITALFHSAPAYSSGVITHIGQAQGIIDLAKKHDGTIPESIASIITKNPETERAFRSGALDSDILNALVSGRWSEQADTYIIGLDVSGLSRGTHEKCSSLIASILLKRAKTDVEKAYAYGWALVHLPGDAIGHPFVNLYAGNGGEYGPNPPAKWDYERLAFSGTNGLHLDVEKRFDGYVLNKFGYDESPFPDPNGNIIKSPRLDLDIDIPVSFLKDAIKEAFGPSSEPSWIGLEAAENIMQAILYSRAKGLIDNNHPEDSRFWENYNTALEGIEDWMRNPNRVNDNYNLDDGTPNPDGCPEMKSKIPIVMGAGNDHSDDTVDVGTLQAAGEVAFEDWLRVAIKNGKSEAIFTWELKNKLNEFKSLPVGTDLMIREQRKKDLVEFFKANVNNADSIEAFRESNPTLIEGLATAEDVGILYNGFAEEMAALIARIKEPTVQIPPEIFSDGVRDKKVIIIPSGGLYGLESSEIFKASLDEYVKSGGTLIVFGQQHGYEFSVLPVPQEEDGTYKKVRGFGWSEDQACQYRSSYIDTWHQMLSGQSNNTPSVNVDGYFTDYPSNTTVLLRRTANGQPDLLMYEYGLGRVIVTSMYTDQALRMGQAYAEEIALVRDIITWAKQPDQLPEITPGQSITAQVTVNNITSHEAGSVTFFICDPDRAIKLSEQNVIVSIPAEQSTTIPVTYTSPPISALGIYHIDYALYDSAGNIIQPQAETDSGRFAVSNPPKTGTPDKPIWFSVSTSSQEVFFGTSFDYTFHIFNNINEPRNLGIRNFLRHTNRSHEWNVVAAPNGETMVSGSDLFIDTIMYETMVSYLYDELGKEIGRYELSFKGKYPSVNISINTDKAQYAKGETVTIGASLTNNMPPDWQPTVKIVVMDPKWTEVFRDSKTLLLPPSGSGFASTSFILPPTLLTGSYQIDAQVLFDNKNVAETWTLFELPQSQISVAPSLPSAFNTGANTIPFLIANTGKISVSSGTIGVSLKAPDRSVVYSGSQPFSIAVGESKLLGIPIFIPSLQFGYYTLTFTQTDETRVGEPALIVIPNFCSLNVLFDKPSYKIGETTTFAVSATNTGKFIQEASLAIDIPFLGFFETKPVTINPSEIASMPYTLLLPPALREGGSVWVTLTFPSGERLYWNTYLAIKPVKISQEIAFDKPSYRIRENLGINYNITNDGNFASPLNVSLNLSIPDMNYTHEGILVLEPLNAAGVSLQIPVPETILAGQHNLSVALALPWGIEVKETKFVVPESSLIVSYPGATTLRTGEAINLTIENTGGVDTTYTTQKLSIIGRQGVEIYHGSVTGAILAGERKPLVDIQMPDQAVNGTVLLDIQTKDHKTGKMSNFFKPLEIRGLTASLQTRTDKDAYLNTESITGISNILNGEVGIEGGSLKLSVSKIGRAATGQFTHFLPKMVAWHLNYPYGVAVGPDGSVYVADTNNYRIQKYDNNGDFVTNWGTEGSGDGEFELPNGIAVGVDGSVYVADTENHRVQKFDSNGSFIGKWGSYCMTDPDGNGVPEQSCDGQFNYPVAIGIGPDRSVYVADSGNHRIQKFDGNGNLITKWGGYCSTDTDNDGMPDQSCDGQFASPSGLVIGSDGSVYVADTVNHRIQKFDSVGSLVAKWGSLCIADPNWDGQPDQPCDGQFYYPFGVALRSNGLVYVIDSGNNRVEEFDNNGNFITRWGTGCSTDADWDDIPEQPCDGQFNWPGGISVGPDDSLYVADTNNHRIEKFDSIGNFTAKWGSKSTGREDGEFRSPKGVAVGSGGSIFVADTENRRIQKFDSNGNFITQWYNFYGEAVPRPAGIAAGPEGSIYVGNTDFHRIQKYGSDGDFITGWGGEGSGEGQFTWEDDSPVGIAVDPDGSVYVADSGNHRIQKFGSSGNFITQWGSYCMTDSNEDGVVEQPCDGQFNYPSGIVIGPDGFIYVTDSRNNRIQKFDINGNFITKWGSYCSTDPDGNDIPDLPCDGQFAGPSGIAVGSDGFVYVADTWNNRIQKFDSGGNFLAKWGNPGIGNGQFYYPVGIATAPDGSIYVADTGNHRIQRLIWTTIEDVAETVFETALPINQSGSTTQDYTTDIGTVNATGKLLLQAILKNSLGQTIAQASYPFYIVDGNTVLLLNTDKRTYKLAEIVTITGQIENRASIQAENLTFTLNSRLRTSNSELLYTEGFNIPAGGTHPFTVTTTAGAEGTMTLAGKVTQNNSTLVEIVDQYEVAKPNVSVSVTTPDVVGSDPFSISVEMKNTGKVGVIIQLVVQGSEFGDGRTITIPAGEMNVVQYSQQISRDMAYSFILTGDLEQTIPKAVRFGESAKVQLTLQPLYKEGEIVIPYQLENVGELEAAYPVTFTLIKNGLEISRTARTFILPVGGSLLDSLSCNLGDGLYILRYETRGFQAESQIEVVKAAQGEITIGVNDYYPEGTIVLPYTVRNTGSFDGEFSFEFELGTSHVSETALIPAGGDHAGNLHYDLSSGDYTVRATLASQPSNFFTRSFRVLKENQAEMAIALGTQTNGLVPVNVNLTNVGYNEINGSVNVGISPSASSGQAVWNGKDAVSQLLPQNSRLITFNINPSGIPPGDYGINVELLSNSNQVIQVGGSEFTVRSSNFQITQVPSYQTFYPGQGASFTFRVMNTGNQEGAFDLRLKAYDLIDTTQRAWLKAGEEKSVTFGFMLPEDLEEKDYFATYELKAQSSAVSGVPAGQIRYHLAGISLNVNASLDKPNYNEGETAHLTINIQSTNPNPQNLFARVNYAGYEPQQTFTLSGSQVLIFDVPLIQITSEKLFYGIYHEGGRSMHLNSLYIHKAGDVLTIETDKQVYNPGESVSVSASGNVSGNMTLSGPGGYTETFPFSNQVTRNFLLPSTMIAGTYFIDAHLTTAGSDLITASHPFDVAGIQVKVLECQNDKGKYASSDIINTSLTISSNTTIQALFKAWIVDPKGQYSSVGEQSINLSSPENSLITHQSSLAASVSGIHRLVYGVYSGDLLLVSGSEAFDIGDAVLLGLSMNKRDYPTNTELVIATISLFGSINANLDLDLDGNVIKSESVSLNGIATYTTQLQNIIPGPHALKATLAAGGLSSTKETSFTYALAYMPKPQISVSPAYLDFGNINLGSTSTKSLTLSSTGNVDLVVGTITLSGTNLGEFSIRNDNCSGRTITPPGTCTLDILFSPISLGSKSGSLSIPSNALDTPTLFLSLGGVGVTNLNISIYPEGSGVVTGTGIECPGDCSESFSASGASIQLTASAAEGYQFVNWTGDMNLTENPVTIHMDGNKNVTANFILGTCTINISATSGGVTSPSGPIAVNQGASLTLIIIPNTGYHIVEVKVDGASVGAVASYTFNNVTTNHTVEASFGINQYTITAMAGENGTISPSGSVTVEHGGTQAFSITPASGYDVADVLIDGASVGALITYMFTNVTGNHAIEASFRTNLSTATWAKTYGGHGHDVAFSVRQTKDGGHVIAGESWSLRPLFSDAWIIKLDSNGDIQWQKAYGGPLNDVIYSIEETQDGGYIMAGETSAVLPFLGLFWVVKVNENGEVQWQKTYGQGWAHSVQQTSEGGFIAAGMNKGGAWIVKLKPNGDIQWQKGYRGITGDWAHSVEQTADGGYLVAGMMKGEAWVLKLDSSGKTQWQKTYGNSSLDASFSIQQTREGGYIMASLSFTFGAGSADFWIVKLDPNGEIEWQKTYGGSRFDLARSIRQTHDGGYVVAGWTQSYGAGEGDAWVLKLDPTGEIEWQKTYGGTEFDSAHSIRQTEDGGYVVTGKTESFGAGQTDVWVLKLDANGDISGCQEGLITETHIIPYDTNAAARRCNEKDQTTSISPKKGNTSVRSTAVTPAGVCGN